MTRKRVSFGASRVEVSDGARDDDDILRLISSCLSQACSSNEDPGREPVALWLVLDDGEKRCWVLSESGVSENPDSEQSASVECSLKTFLAIAAKETTLTKAAMRGHIRVKGKHHIVKAWKPVLSQGLSKIREGQNKEQQRRPAVDRRRKDDVVVMMIPLLKRFRLEARLRKGRWRVRFNSKTVDKAKDIKSTPNFTKFKALLAENMRLPPGNNSNDDDKENTAAEHDHFEEIVTFRDFHMMVQFGNESMFRLKATSRGTLDANTSFELRTDAPLHERQAATDLVFAVLKGLQFGSSFSCLSSSSSSASR